MAKRLSTDAKIVLQNAGYTMAYVSPDRYGQPKFLQATHNAFIQELEISGGCVDNAEVEELLTISKYWNR